MALLAAGMSGGVMAGMPVLTGGMDDGILPWLMVDGIPVLTGGMDDGMLPWLIVDGILVLTGGVDAGLPLPDGRVEKSGIRSVAA